MRSRDAPGTADTVFTEARPERHCQCRWLVGSFSWKFSIEYFMSLMSYTLTDGTRNTNRPLCTSSISDMSIRFPVSPVPVSLCRWRKLMSHQPTGLYYMLRVNFSQSRVWVGAGNWTGLELEGTTRTRVSRVGG